jgi:ubiquinone/menaquinone biosynthesis C-methylase UbiE
MADDDLMPKTNQEYSTKEYWDWRYERDNGSYEWFKGYKAFQHIIKKYFKSGDRLLNVGCGNSDLSAEIYDDNEGLNIVNIDYSEVCIQKMTEKNKERTNMQWLTMDMFDMKAFEDGSFDIVLDKGTMDAILTVQKSPWTLEPELEEKVTKLVNECYRVCKPGGYFIQITFGQPHFRKPMLLREGFKWEVTTETFGDGFPYFVYIFHKSAE